MQYREKYALILDAGGGNGNNRRLLAPYDFRILFNDISQKMINKARENLKGYKNIQFMPSCDMRKLVLPTCSLDAIIASYSLIHMFDQDIILTLKKFNSFLKM